MNHFGILSTIALLLLASSCSDNEQEARKVVERFAEAAKENSDTASAKDCYPDFHKLAGDVKVGDFQINEIMEVKNDTFNVMCTNGYYDKNAHFVQDTVKLTVGKAKQGKIEILQSVGLFQLSKPLKKYGLITGKITRSTSDSELRDKYRELFTAFCSTLYSYENRLNNGIKINHWEWEVDFGTPNGKATVTNTLPFDVYNIQYHITYKHGATICGEDEGLALSKLRKGEKKTFQFYSSGVTTYGGTATLTFQLPGKLALEWMFNDIK